VAGTTNVSGAVEASSYTTVFGSLANYTKGGVELINDDPRHYAFSNVYEVANMSKPWEQVAVGKNMEYVLEVVRAEGTSGWRSASHDQFAVCMDGEVEVEFYSISNKVDAAVEGSVALEGEPDGVRMGRVVLGFGHQGLLPAGAAYRMTAANASVVLLQTIAGADTKFRWSEICQTA
jgi:hypothetical protein